VSAAPRVLVSGVLLDQPPGGVQRHNQELLPRLARRLSEGGGGVALLAPRGGLPWRLPQAVELLPSEVPSHPSWVRAAAEPRALARAARDARKSATPFDLVHCGHLPPPLGLRLPFTFTLHDLRHLDRSRASRARRLVVRSVLGRALRRAARVFTVSEHTAEGLRSFWPPVASKLTLVPNGADHFTPERPEREPGAPLLHLGHLEPRKNLELLVRALATDPDLPALLLAGGAKGNERERLEALACELGVAARVHFHGPFAETELPQLLATCAAVVLPSHLEGFGIVALEALRARAPLAISTAGALPEVVGPHGERFDPRDPHSCARAVRAALARDPTSLEAAAQHAARFTWDAAADAWAQGLRAAARGG